MEKSSIRRTLKTEHTLLAIHSDMHSGSSTALFLNRFWQNEHQNHTPNDRQKSIYSVWEKVSEYAKQTRKGKRLIVVHNGDAIEGLHHNSPQICVGSKDSQAEIHTELMDGFLRATKFEHKRGDRLFYVRGTETHVEDKENEIAADLSAEKTPDGLHVFDHLEIEINGRLIWAVHHGKKRGAGANEGNAMRNWMRDIYWDCRKANIRPPDLIVSGHTHTPTYNSYIIREGSLFHITHGVVCPSWQAKTRFAYKVAPVEVNEIGSVFIEITADGDIRPPKFIIQDSRQYESVKI